MTGGSPVVVAGLAAAGAVTCWMVGVVLARRAIPLRRAMTAPSARGVVVARRTPLAALMVTGPRRTLLAAAGLAIGIVLPWPGLLLAPVLAVVGARLPSILAGRAATRHRAALDADVPQLLDLLAAGSSAGLSAQLALRRAVDAIDGPLATELTTVLSRVDLGARWRDELGELVERSGSSDLRRAVSVLSRTETLGVSLEESTAELAATVRAARRAAVTERARTAPVKMLFPLVFLVLPAFLLLTVVPVLLTTLRSIR